MKVKELIKVLLEFDMDYEVYFEGNDKITHNINRVRYSDMNDDLDAMSIKLD